jgi:hypothetical protein
MKTDNEKESQNNSKKLSFFFIIYILFSFYSFSQKTVQIEINGLSHSRNRQLYIGVNNPFTLKVKSVASEKMIVDASVGIATGDQGNYVFFLPYQVEHPLTTTVLVSYLNSGNDTVFADSVVFELKHVPDPIITISGICKSKIGNCKSKIKKELFVKCDSLEVEAIAGLPKVDFKIISFSMTYDCGPASDCSIKQQYGGTFTDIMKLVIGRSKHNQLFYFEDIKCKGSDGTIRSPRPICFRVK